MSYQNIIKTRKDPQSLWEDQYLRHGAAVRASVPSSHLLVYRVGEGWDRLCHFLELQVPHSPFPQENKAGQAGNIVDKVQIPSCRVFRIH